MPLSAGGSRRFDYVLAGKVGKAVARGRLQVKITETDAAGAPLPTCDTGPMTWKATSS